MDKVPDWKKYVEEETSRAKSEGRFKGEPRPKRPVPGIDEDRFRIRRSLPVEESAAPEPVRMEPPAPQPQPVKRPTTTAPQPQPKSPLASPFVSVQQVWDAAESGGRAAVSPAPARPETAEQRPLPGFKKIAPESREDIIKSRRVRPGHEQSREEILERLVNPTITLEEAAKIMGVCKATVRRYTARGALSHYRTPGNQRRFKLNDIITFMEDQKKS